MSAYYPILDEITGRIATLLGVGETVEYWALEELQQMQALLCQAKSVPLLPRHKIYYAALPSVDNERFVRVWRETWACIPSGARRALLRHWRSLPLYDMGAAPLFYCVPNLHATVRKNVIKLDGVRSCYFESTEYCADVVNSIPDHILAILIAHELAHPVFELFERRCHPEKYTATYSPFSPLIKTPEIFKAEREQDEDSVISTHERWGFSMKEYREWMWEHEAQLEASHKVGIGTVCRCGDPPQAFDAYLDRAIKMHNRRKYEAALRYAELAALIRPLSQNVLRLQGSCYFFLSQLEHAVKIQQRTAKLYPISQEVSEDLHLSLSVANRDEEAFAEIKRFLALRDSAHFAEYVIGFMKVLKMATYEDEEEIFADMKQELRNGKSDLFDEFASIALRSLNKDRT